jgi:energy-coupling factor transporter ATP-binding protein EcfA2
MKYKKFIIENYKGIAGPIEVSIEKNSLIPIIGVNECGKTTILNSIYAFDFTNDDENETFKHLSDITNLYREASQPCRLSAVVEVTKESLRENLRNVAKMSDIEMEEIFKQLNAHEKFDITISRNMEWKNNSLQSRYEIFPKIKFKSKNAEDNFCKELIRGLPFILYFDDFRETFPDRIEINTDDKTKWLDILEQLFKKTNENYSVYNLKDFEERRRKSILSHVKKKLNETLTTQWANFRLENKESLEIDIDFQKEKHLVRYEADEMGADGKPFKRTISQETEKYFLKFDIIERDSNGDEHFFYVRDRSKGFYWFFNFVMKLEFNPDIAGDHNNTIYLLDEPGSYLHPYAQTKLCQKLKDLSESNIVIYCTHSHYLLNPEVIPLNKIHVATKNPLSDISLVPFYKYRHEPGQDIQTAFQTIYDALYIKPFDIDINHKKILIVEGIYDYYSYSLFKGDYDFGILPGKGADSLISFISLMIAYEVDFRVLWDYDPEGIQGYEKATHYFGDEIASRNFFLLPSKNGSKRILQNLFEGADLELIINELNLDGSISFEKKISSLYYSNRKEEILNQFKQKTVNNFREVFEKLQLIKTKGQLAVMEE